jgi:hypothetical protein
LTTLLGELEPTLLRNFIRAARLQRWLSREDAPYPIKECAALLEKYIPKRQRGTAVDYSFPLPNDMEVEPNDEDPQVQPVPTWIHSTQISGELAFRKKVSYKGTVYACSESHLGNSNVLFFTSNSRKIIPGRIRHIFIHNDRTYFGLSQHLDKNNTFVDPFIPYKDFPAKVFSSNYSKDLTIVDGENVVCHFARLSLNFDHSVILSLKKAGNFWSV